MGKRTFWNEAWGPGTSFTIESSRTRDELINLLVSSINDEGVAVKTGGACGGLRYLAGDIATVARGLNAVWTALEAFGGLKWPRMVVSRGAYRDEARMMETTTKQRVLNKANFGK